MITAHRQLGDEPGTYRSGWEILADDGTVVAIVKTRREAQRIVDHQAYPQQQRERMARIGQRIYGR